MNFFLVYLALIDMCLIFRARTKSTISSMILHSMPSKSIKRSDGAITVRIPIGWNRWDDHTSVEDLIYWFQSPCSIRTRIRFIRRNSQLKMRYWARSENVEFIFFIDNLTIRSHILCGETTVKRAGMSGLNDGSVIILRYLQISIYRLPKIYSLRQKKRSRGCINRIGAEWRNGGRRYELRAGRMMRW